MPSLQEMAQDSAFTVCAACNKADLVLKPTKFGTLFIACKGFPACKNTMPFLPDINFVKMCSQGRCTKCYETRTHEVR